MKTTLIVSMLMTFFGLSDIYTETQIQGKVTEESTGEPVLFASVGLYKDGVLVSGTDTDFDGNYFFRGIEPGKYDLEVQYLGLQTTRKTKVKAKAGVVTTVDIIMKEEGVMVDCIEVVGYKVPLVEMDNTTSGSVLIAPKKGLANKVKKVFRKKRKKKLESLPSKSMSALAATSAGISVSQDNISVRGSRSQSTFYYIDGVRVNADAYTTLKKAEPLSKRLSKRTAESGAPNTEGYNKSIENAFVSPLLEPQSTFSLDVDKASYSNIRRMINYGQLPPADAVRVEEMINYFEYDYELPDNQHPIVVRHNYTSCPWNKDHRLLHLSMKATEIETESLPATNLVFLVDVSGSMNAQNKLPLVISSLKLLVNQLRPDDRVAIVTYAGRAGVALESTPAAEKEIIYAGLERLKSGGGTAGSQGIRTAYAIANENFIEGGNNRVILATDGDFNIGVSTAEGLLKLIERKRESGIFLSVLGYGMGNYQDHNMQTLAGNGNGNHAYIDSYAEAKKVLVNEFAGTLFTVAKDVKIQIDFNPSEVQSYRLIGYENRMLAAEDFDDDKKDAGEVGSGHTVTAIYEIIPAGSSSSFSVDVGEEMINKTKKSHANGLAHVKCRYKKSDGRRSTKFVTDIPSRLTEVSSLGKDIQFSIAVAEFGMNVGQSAYLKTSDLNNCLNLAMENIGEDSDGYRAEFIELVKQYMTLVSVASDN